MIATFVVNFPLGRKFWQAQLILFAHTWVVVASGQFGRTYD